MPIKTSSPRLSARRPLPALAQALAAVLVLAAGLEALPARAQGIFLCVDATGRRLLTDTGGPGCKSLDTPASIAAPPARRAAAPVTTQPNFPKVDNAQQRARDNDRREILSEELRNEEKKLAELKGEFNNGEPERQGNERNYVKYAERIEQMRQNIARSEKNIEALKREMANIK